MIPKAIHYCWVGESKLDAVGRKCLDSWKRFCPDWTIKEWNDSNLPQGFEYLANARTHRMFSNVSNFIRLYAVYHHGGIYLDTDAELIADPTVLLNERCFFGFQVAAIGSECVNNAIFGAVQHHPFVKAMLAQLVAQYSGLEASNLSGPGLVTDMLRQEKGLSLGLETDASKVTLGDITIFPKRFFAPFAWNEKHRPGAVTTETIVIHRWTASWIDKPSLVSKVRRRVASVLRRIKVGIVNGVATMYSTLVVSRILNRRMKKISGPSVLPDLDEGVTLVCLVKNGALCIRPFIEHHFRLGVKRMVFVDNQSTDQTVSIAKEYDGVSVYELDYPLVGHQSQLLARRHAIDRFCRSKWCLWLDIDEFFDYPFSERLSLNALTAYLETYSYTAVIGQMLDMFSDRPLNELPEPATDARLFKEQYPYYDISNIDQSTYSAVRGYEKHHNRVANPRIKFHSGGIRKTVFGTNQWLTKHPLIFLDGTLRPVTQQHWVTRASCADLSCVLYHYKFLPDFYQRNLSASESGFGSSGDYGRLARTYREDPAVILRRGTARKLGTAMDLVENGFLVLSEQYRNWGEGQRASSAPEDGSCV